MTIFDFGSFSSGDASSRGEWLQLLHPVSGESIGVEIKLLGRDSAAYVNKARDINAAKFAKAGRGKKLDLLPSDDEQVDLLVAVTAEWRGVVVNGEALAFSPENVRKLYAEQRWVREQVDLFVGDRANFLMSA
jgi:hypothetical protein